MKKLISEEIFDLLKKKNDVVVERLKNLFIQLSNDSIRVGASFLDNEQYLSFNIEAYAQDLKADEYGVILSITFQRKNEVIEGEFSIIKESGQFILSPKTHEVKYGSIPNDFMLELNEYYNVFELILKNYMLSKENYISSYDEVW